MIFGQTVEQIAEEKSNAAKKAIFGIKKFALKPKKLTDGRTVWLSFYYEYRDGKLDCNQYELRDYTRRYLEHSLNHVVLYKSYRQMDIEALEEVLNNVPHAI